ncbi:Swt1 family HEPN domain-containing protein [Microbacterium enclense]|uniref:Swt1 family HEPN domain-containing protein n=1 Tax=Microbacterium enclense TaxID=993073 RepID=UPI003D73D963
MTIDTRQIIGGSVDDLAEGLRPFIERVFAERLPDGQSWVQIVAHEDELAGRPTAHHHANDVGLMLRVMTEKLGNLGYPFDGHLSRQAANWASEMREVRNKHAHQVEFSPAETYRALDSAELLLREVGAADEAQRIAARKPAVLSALSGGVTGRPLPPPPSASLPAPRVVRLPAPPAVPLPSSAET